MLIISSDNLIWKNATLTNHVFLVDLSDTITAIIYASTVHAADDSHGGMTAAINNVLATDGSDNASVLWSMTYVNQMPVQNDTNLSLGVLMGGKVLAFPQRLRSLAFDDAILDQVKAAWEAILGNHSKDYDFLHFRERKDDDSDD